MTSATDIYLSLVFSIYLAKDIMALGNEYK